MTTQLEQEFVQLLKEKDFIQDIIDNPSSLLNDMDLMFEFSNFMEWDITNPHKINYFQDTMSKKYEIEKKLLDLSILELQNHPKEVMVEHILENSKGEDPDYRSKLENSSRDQLKNIMFFQHDISYLKWGVEEDLMRGV